MQTYGSLLQNIKARLLPLYPEQEVKAITHALLKHYARLSPAALYIRLNEEVDASVEQCVATALEQLGQYKPLQYILGETEFYGLPFLVNENVLIPRPETEELVAWAEDVLTQTNQTKPAILDIGTGSGCIAVTLAHLFPQAQVSAIDLSAGALEVAKANAARNKVTIRFLQDDILNPRLEYPLFDCIISNPPYVRDSEKAQMLPNVLQYEPHTALFVPDTDALVFYRAIARFAQKQLSPKGIVLLEINEALGKQTAEVFHTEGFGKTELRKDINGRPRMLCAKK